MFSSKSLVQWTGGRWRGEVSCPIKGFHFDTRCIKPGQVFVAISTSSRDGHDYLKDALQKGAVAALVERYQEGVDIPQLLVKDSVKAFQAIAKQHRKLLNIPVIGITGSFGKTSTKDTLHLLLGENIAHKTEHTFNNTLGVPYTLTQVDPDRHHYAVIEAGINMSGEMDVLADMIQPDVSIVTLIAGHHLEHLGSEEKVAREKVKLVEAMSPSGMLYAHYSCMFFECFKQPQYPARILMPQGHSLNFKLGDALVEYRLERISKTQTRIILFGKKLPEISIVMPMVSRGMLSNLSLAALAALDLGVPESRIQEKLYNWMPSNIRGQLLVRGEQTFYVDTYNSGVLSLKNSLDHFNEIFAKTPKRLFVIAAMHELGELSDQFHYDLGCEMDYHPDDQFVIINQKAKPLAQGLIDQGINPSRVTWIEEPEQAKRFIQAFEGPVFLKGSKPYKLHQLVPEGASLLNLNEL